MSQVPVATTESVQGRYGQLRGSAEPQQGIHCVIQYARRFGCARETAVSIYYCPAYAQNGCICPVVCSALLQASFVAVVLDCDHFSGSVAPSAASILASAEAEPQPAVQASSLNSVVLVHHRVLARQWIN
jgi:hypothetical protein